MTERDAVEFLVRAGFDVQKKDVHVYRRGPNRVLVVRWVDALTHPAVDEEYREVGPAVDRFLGLVYPGGG